MWGKRSFLLFLAAFSFFILGKTSLLAQNLGSPPSTPGTGRIVGTVGYPSDAIPPLVIVAFQNDDRSKFQKVETGKNQSTFTIPNLSPGNYVVVAYPKSNDPLQGGYTKAVPCGLEVSCKDHSLIPVKVEAGKAASGVEVKDWYAPDNAFPPKP